MLCDIPIITFLVSAITARIYPLSKKTQTYYNDQEGEPEVVIRGGIVRTAIDEGMGSFMKAPTIAESVLDNLKME